LWCTRLACMMCSRDGCATNRPDSNQPLVDIEVDQFADFD
jgi:hypothetical protein